MMTVLPWPTLAIIRTVRQKYFHNCYGRELQLQSSVKADIMLIIELIMLKERRCAHIVLSQVAEPPV